MRFDSPLGDDVSRTAALRRMRDLTRDEAKIRLSIRVARKAMLEGKEPRDTVDIIRSMHLNQDLIDKTAGSGRALRDEQAGLSDRRFSESVSSDHVCEKSRINATELPPRSTRKQ